MIGDERLTWTLILGNIAYFFYRATLLILLIASVTLFVISPQLRKYFREQPAVLLAMPFICGLVPGLLFYTESRFKVVSELLLVPLVLMTLTEFRKIHRNSFVD